MKKIIIILLMMFLVSCASAQTKIPYVLGTWNKNTEQDLAGYKVYWGTSSRDYDSVIDVGKNNNTVLSDTLLYDISYYFAVTAYDTAGNESEYSEQVIFYARKSVRDTLKPRKPKNPKFIEFNIRY